MACGKLFQKRIEQYVKVKPVHRLAAEWATSISFSANTIINTVSSMVLKGWHSNIVEMSTNSSLQRRLDHCLRTAPSHPENDNRLRSAI